MKIAIVGANSYIARNLLYVLKKRIPDCEIMLYDCLDIQLDGEENYTKVNILDKQSVININMNCDIIYIFAGKNGSEIGFDDYESFIQVNELGLLNLLNEYRNQHSRAKIIYPSTRLVYKGSQFPLKEDAQKELKTIYAINKYAAEQYLKIYNLVYNISYCVFRICIPYGTLIENASSYGTIGFMLCNALAGKNIVLYGDGSAKRTFTYIEDICNSLIDGAFCSRCINDVFNIGGEEFSLKEVSEMIAKKYNVGIEYTEYPKIALEIETGDTVFDASKLKRIGISTMHKLEEWITGTM